MKLRNFLQLKSGFMLRSGGFTLAELLVVVSIISILSTSTVVGSVNVSRRASVVAVQKNLEGIVGAYHLLDLDTKRMPGGVYATEPNSCPAFNLEVALTDPCSGMLQDHPGAGCSPSGINSGSYPNWKGPYVQALNNLIDPWGNAYVFDPDYRCHTYVQGCENVPNEQWVRAIYSAGPDGNASYGPGGVHGPHGAIYPDQDNIVQVICRP